MVSLTWPVTPPQSNHDREPVNLHGPSHHFILRSHGNDMITFQGPHHAVLLLVWLFLNPRIIERKRGGESEKDSLCPSSLSVCINMSPMQLCSLGLKRLQGLHVHMFQVLNPCNHLTRATVTTWTFYGGDMRVLHTPENTSFASLGTNTHALIFLSLQGLSVDFIVFIVS